MRLSPQINYSDPLFREIRSADEVARRLLAATRGRRFENPLGWDGWLSFLASRYFPGLVRRLNDSDLRKAIDKHGSPDGGAKGLGPSSD